MKIQLPDETIFLDFEHTPKDKVKPEAVWRKTLCYLSKPGFEFTETGEAYCNPKDNFCKETGRKIALTRAIASYPREKRKAIWQAYRSRKKSANAEQPQ